MPQKCLILIFSTISSKYITDKNRIPPPTLKIKKKVFIRIIAVIMSNDH